MSYPEVHLELRARDAPLDVVAKGFDAGIGPPDWAAADMITVRVMGPLKMAIVGAPTYFARRGHPRTPDDLARHSCIQIRRNVDNSKFEWPLEHRGKSRRISVNGPSGQDNSCGCWIIGHPPTKDFSFTIPATDRFRPRYAPSST